VGSDNDDTQRIIDEALAGLGSADIQTLAQRLALAGATSVDDLLAETRPPVRRRPAVRSR
jgi:hypothetical protein